MMNIFLRELKAHRKSLLIWSICMFLLVASGMVKYSAFVSSGQSINDILTKMPYSIKALLGFGSFDMSKISGYYALLFLYIEIAAAIHAVLLGSGIIAKEERDKTAEFLMTKPVARTTIITAKLLAALVNVLIINIVTLVSSIEMVAAYNKGESVSGEIVMFDLSLLIVQLIFLSLGAALAAILRNPKTAGSLSAGILLISFFISKITDMTDRLKFLNLFSPFKYFSYQSMVAGNGLDVSIVIISLLLVAAFAASTYFFYRKRDLSI